jgi:hypothetical protein
VSLGFFFAFSVFALPAFSEDCATCQSEQTASREFSRPSFAVMKKKCEVVPTFGHSAWAKGKLSPFWGHEFVGADLARELVESDHLKRTPVRVATLEDVNEFDAKSFHHHGTMVANVVLGAKPYGVAAHAQMVSTGGEYDTDGAAKVAMSKPELIELSLSVSESARMEALAATHAVVVRSSGNYFPESHLDQARPDLSILVGQLAPTGAAAATSSSSPDVTILAPSSSYTISTKGGSIGGTSGAQPMVSGCLANAIAYLPGLTTEDARLLLEKTAIPTWNANQKPRASGAGTVNCLKIAEVARRLRLDWPKSRSRIVNDSRLMDFSSEAADFIARARTMGTDRCGRQQQLRLLRHAFLLDYKRGDVVGEIAKVYREQGYVENAWLYESLSGVSEAQILAGASRSNASDFPDWVRLALEAGCAKAVVDQGLHSRDATAVLSAAKLGSYPKGDVEVKKALIQMVLDMRVSGYAYSEFLRVFYDQHGFSARDVLDVCTQQFRKWSKPSEWVAPVPVCMEATRRDPKEGARFILSVCQRSERERDKILGQLAFQSESLNPTILEALEDSRIPWSPKQLVRLRELKMHTANP